jgi:hypothetical protein
LATLSRWPFGYWDGRAADGMRGHGVRQAVGYRDAGHVDDADPRLPGKSLLDGV